MSVPDVFICAATEDDEGIPPSMRHGAGDQQLPPIYDAEAAYDDPSTSDGEASRVTRNGVPRLLKFKHKCRHKLCTYKTHGRTGHEWADDHGTHLACFAQHRGQSIEACYLCFTRREKLQQALDARGGRPSAPRAPRAPNVKRRRTIGGPRLPQEPVEEYGLTGLSQLVQDSIGSSPVPADAYASLYESQAVSIRHWQNELTADL
jgi:hypothetical protein